MDKKTSDERLLKLIEGTNEPKLKPEITAGERKPLALAGFITAKLNLPKLKSKFTALKINLFSVNKGLIGLAAFLTIVFLYTIVSGPVIPKSNAAFFTPADTSAVIKLISVGQEPGSMRKNISSLDIKRDFFLNAGSPSSVYRQEDGPNLSEELKNLKLVGIIWSQNPEVMIENTKDSRTYTLKKGESLNEGLKVKDISRNSATLETTTSAGSKEYELR
jgi:hypothetical protein